MTSPKFLSAPSAMSPYSHIQSRDLANMSHLDCPSELQGTNLLIYQRRDEETSGVTMPREPRLRRGAVLRGRQIVIKCGTILQN